MQKKVSKRLLGSWNRSEAITVVQHSLKKVSKGSWSYCRSDCRLYTGFVFCIDRNDSIVSRSCQSSLRTDGSFLLVQAESAIVAHRFSRSLMIAVWEPFSSLSCSHVLFLSFPIVRTISRPLSSWWSHFVAHLYGVLLVFSLARVNTWQILLLLLLATKWLSKSETPDPGRPSHDYNRVLGHHC